MIDMTSQRLVISGGAPVRAEPIEPAVHLDAIALRRLEDLIARGKFSDWYGGPLVREFEREFAAYHGEAHAVAVNSGTSALHLACAAIGIGPGDEVIVPAAAYVSAASVVVQLGGTPVICDIDPLTFTMDPVSFERACTERTKAVIPVHFWGSPCDMRAIAAIANKYGCAVIEDCGQAHGAPTNDGLVGMLGDLACYSFAPRKHISTGEGGLVMTRSAQLADTVRMLANKGKGNGWLDYRRLGYSYVMTEFAALLGQNGLRHLRDEIDARRAAVALYRERLAGTELQFPVEPNWGTHIYFKLPLALPAADAAARDFVVRAISAENVSCRPTHPPMYEIPWLRTYMVSKGVDCNAATCPAAASVLPRIFEIETGPMLPLDEAERSARAVLKMWTELRTHGQPAAPHGATS